MSGPGTSGESLSHQRAGLGLAVPPSLMAPDEVGDISRPLGRAHELLPWSGAFHLRPRGRLVPPLHLPLVLLLLQQGAHRPQHRLYVGEDASISQRWASSRFSRTSTLVECPRRQCRSEKGKTASISSAAAARSDAATWGTRAPGPLPPAPATGGPRPDPAGSPYRAVPASPA